MFNWIQLFKSFEKSVERTKEQACSARVFGLVSPDFELRHFRLLELSGVQRPLMGIEETDGRHAQAEKFVNDTEGAYWLDMAWLANGIVKTLEVQRDKIIDQDFLACFGPYWNPAEEKESKIKLRDVKVLVINDVAADYPKASGYGDIENMYARLRPLFREDFCVIRLK